MRVQQSVLAAGKPTLGGIAVDGLSKSYRGTRVLDALSLDVPGGSLTAVLGASGSGKTTLLRVIAGFEGADSGAVSIGGRLVDDGSRTVRPQHRGVGYVPQDGGLFPHLTVRGNIGFGVPRRKRGGLAALISLVGLSGFEHRFPHQLSGGQQQRVALARALAIRPRVVLLDEPFGSLDASLRESVRADVADILARTGTTTVLVTHDQDEALSLADHIALLEGGRIIAHGDPRDLYDHPPTPQIATAIGSANILSGYVDGERVNCALGPLPLPTSAPRPPTACTLLLRPEQLVLSTKAGLDQPTATIGRVRYHGHDTLIDLTDQSFDGPELVARASGRTGLRPGERVWLTITGAPHVWDA